MLLSSSLGVVEPVGLAVSEHGVEDVDASTCERDDGLVVAVSLNTKAGVEGLAGGVAERAEGGLEEDPFERLVAARGTFQVADLAGLFEHRREPGDGGQAVGGRKAPDRACLGDELGREGGPHPWQATDEGRVRVALKGGPELRVELGEPGPAAGGLERELADEFGGD